MQARSQRRPWQPTNDGSDVWVNRGGLDGERCMSFREEREDRKRDRGQGTREGDRNKRGRKIVTEGRKKAKSK